MSNIFSYPPTPEQLDILHLIGINNGTGLWGLRLVSLLVLFITIFFWVKYLKKLIKYPKVAGLLILLSPVSLVMVLAYPVILFKLLLVAVVLNINTKIWIKTVFAATLILILNIYFLQNNPGIISKVNLENAQSEVMQRFTKEDSLNTKLELPLSWRRIAYNKYFYVYKQAVSEVLPYFDLESWYFQEVHPFDEKGIVLYFWPEIILFILGIYALAVSKNNNLYEACLAVLFVALMNFVFSDGATYMRQILSLLPLSLVMGMGVEVLKKNRLIAGVMVFLIFYGWQANMVDLNVRTERWLDNRPIAMKYWFENIGESELKEMNKIMVTTRVGNPKNYCVFYLQDKCDEERIEFKDFENLSSDEYENGLYLGFVGEVVGSKFKNDISSNWIEEAPTFLEVKSTRPLTDTIAYRFGNELVAVYKTNE